MTYRVGGNAIHCDRRGLRRRRRHYGWPLDPASAAYRYGNEGRIIVLKVGGPPPPLPALRTDPPLS